MHAEKKEKREKRRERKDTRFNSRGSESIRKTSKRWIEAIRKEILEDSPLKPNSLPQSSLPPSPLPTPGPVRRGLLAAPQCWVWVGTDPAFLTSCLGTRALQRSPPPSDQRVSSQQKGSQPPLYAVRKGKTSLLFSPQAGPWSLDKT